MAGYFPPNMAGSDTDTDRLSCLASPRTSPQSGEQEQAPSGHQEQDKQKQYREERSGGRASSLRDLPGWCCTAAVVPLYRACEQNAPLMLSQQDDIASATVRSPVPIEDGRLYMHSAVVYCTSTGTTRRPEAGRAGQCWAT